MRMGALGRLKQLFTESPGEGSGTYVCMSCGARWHCQPQVCPTCDGYDIRRVEWLDDADEIGPDPRE